MKNKTMERMLETLKKKYGIRKPDGIAKESPFSATLFFYPGDNTCSYITCNEIFGKRVNFERTNTKWSHESGTYIWKSGRKIRMENVVKC